jgi:hypothetical protein
VEATQSIITEFIGLHDRYNRASKRILVLQATAIEGMRKMGVGCFTDESRTEFTDLENEITLVLNRMREICESLH